MYTIKRAAELTGVPAATLRAWERRYGVIAPERTESGYRVYDEESLARIRAVADLVADGWAPSHAAREVSRGGGPRTGSPEGPAPQRPASGPAPGDGDGSAATRRLVAAAASLDAAEVGRVLDERLATGSFESVVDAWLLPALEEIGRAWADQRISVAGEHLVAHAVLRRLAAAYDAAASAPGGPTVLVALPPGVHHELGVFAFAVALRRLGVDVVYLGPDLPLTAWRAALEAHGAGCAVLGVPQAADVPAARDVVEGLAHSHPRVQVVAGGREQAALSGPGVLRLGHAIGPAARELADRLARAGAVRG